MDTTTPPRPPGLSRRPDHLEHGHRRAYPKVGRNAPCPCGSEIKHKHCCWEAARAMNHEAALETFALGRAFLEANR